MHFVRETIIILKNIYIRVGLCRNGWNLQVHDRKILGRAVFTDVSIQIWNLNNFRFYRMTKNLFNVPFTVVPEHVVSIHRKPRVYTGDQLRFIQIALITQTFNLKKDCQIRSSDAKKKENILRKTDHALYFSMYVQNHVLSHFRVYWTCQ